MDERIAALERELALARALIVLLVGELPPGHLVFDPRASGALAALLATSDAVLAGA